MSAVAITVEGVLRRMSGGQQIPAGIDLYYGLATRAKLVLLSEDSAPDRGSLIPTPLEHWLLIEGMKEHSRVLYTDVVGRALEAPAAREMQVNQARNQGYSVDLVIDPDPAVAAHLITLGYNVLLFCHAQYSVPAWRPDYRHAPVPWDVLAQRVDDEALLRATDARKEEPDG